MKYILMFIIPAFLFVGCAELQQFVNTAMSEPTNAEVSDGLKEALNIGISNGADRLSAKDGYFKSAYKILLPPEARKVTDRLQAVPGFSDVENVILEKINICSILLRKEVLMDIMKITESAKGSRLLLLISH